MGERILCTEPNPVLHLPAQPIQAFTDELHALAKDMIATMHANNGIGVAAPQVGEPLQLFVANPSRKPGDELVVANPKLKEARARVTVTEGCLSLPGLWGKIKRAERVRLWGQDLNGKKLELEAEGMLAIVLQHEVDHLRGKLFVDRLPWHRRWLLKRKPVAAS